MEDLDVEVLVKHPLVSEIAELARAVASVPMGAVCLVDRDRNWHLSTSGLDPDLTPLAAAIACIESSDEVTLIGESPEYVESGLPIRSGATLQIASPDGDVIGCLCIFDVEKRPYADTVIAYLEALVRQVERHVDRAIEQHHLRDLSIRLVESEQALADTLGRLEISNRDLEHFAYHVAHELQAPLRAVAAFASLLGDSLEGDVDREVLSTAAAHVQAETVRLGDQVASLFALAQFSTSEVVHEIVSLAPLLEEAIAKFADMIGPIELRCDSNLRVAGDVAAIQTIVTNLVSNAFRYRSPHRDLEVAVEALRVEDVVAIEVRDNGIGIAAIDQDRIFEVFQRIDGSGPGAGVGLALCRRIVERLGGSIGVRSELGVGSTFTVRLDAP